MSDSVHGTGPGADSGADLDRDIADRLTRNADGLIAAVVQDATSGRVLMMAWMDDAALAETLATRRGVYFSRSRGQRWAKGESSGHVQHVRSVEIDCDGDTVLLRVDQTGAACHNGTTSCFDTQTLLADTPPVADTSPVEE